MQVLLNYPYPGNIRELENILEHALILCSESTLRRKHLPDYLRQRPPGVRHSAGEDRGVGFIRTHAYPSGAPASQRQPFPGRPVPGHGPQHVVAKMKKYQLNDR